MVRDEMGEPLSLLGAQVILETTNGSPVQTVISPGLEPGVNYEMQVPMDSGIGPDLYKSSALTTSSSFRLKVLVGNTVYLPLEMVGDLSLLGQPAERTRIDLTLGEDADGDGLPDAWERAMISALGGNLTLADIRPGDDSDGDGLSNLNEYLAGTYAFDPSDGFVLTLTKIDANNSMVEFLAIRGRTYSVVVSSDLKVWSPAGFTIPAESPSPPIRQSYVANDFGILKLTIPHATGSAATRFVKAVVQ